MKGFASYLFDLHTAFSVRREPYSAYVKRLDAEILRFVEFG
jgi:hypothetical protein